MLKSCQSVPFGFQRPADGEIIGQAITVVNSPNYKKYSYRYYEID